MLGARNGPWMEEAPVGQRRRVAGDPVGYKHGMQGQGDRAGKGVWLGRHNGPNVSAALGRVWCRRAQGRQDRGGRHARSRPERCCWGQNRIHGHQRRQERRQRRQDPCRLLSGKKSQSMKKIDADYPKYI